MQLCLLMRGAPAADSEQGSGPAAMMQGVAPTHMHLLELLLHRCAAQALEHRLPVFFANAVLAHGDVAVAHQPQPAGAAPQSAVAALCRAGGGRLVFSGVERGDDDTGSGVERREVAGLSPAAVVRPGLPCALPPPHCTQAHARCVLQVWQYSVCLAEMDFACRVAAFSIPAAPPPAGAAADTGKGDLYTLHADALAPSQRVRSCLAMKALRMPFMPRRLHNAARAVVTRGRSSVSLCSCRCRHPADLLQQPSPKHVAVCTFCVLRLGAATAARRWRQWKRRRSLPRMRTTPRTRCMRMLSSRSRQTTGQVCSGLHFRVTAGRELVAATRSVASGAGAAAAEQVLKVATTEFPLSKSLHLIAAQHDVAFWQAVHHGHATTARKRAAALCALPHHAGSVEMDVRCAPQLGHVHRTSNCAACSFAPCAECKRRR